MRRYKRGRPPPAPLEDTRYLGPLADVLTLLAREWEARLYTSRVAAWRSLRTLVSRQIAREQGR